MPCLGGPDGRTLFVTCAQGPVLCTRVDVPGLPVAWCELGGVR
jgi:sugar lactone lactonase YvrE